METQNRKNILTKYTAFIKVAGKSIPAKIQSLFGTAVDGKKTHDEIREDYIKSEYRDEKK